ncbi:MAG: serine protease [Clostridiales bacterium]|jgi:hypothetical protein|nr:serine protease [Eubacteriales bacterium]MDH7566840.1 serine protease [Clostridiales bacterium]
MPSWDEVLTEIRQCNRPDALDFVRRKYLKKLFEITGRNIIAYYSGWLQKPGIKNAGINDDDKNGFMATIHGLDRSKGLDLILHTPGGNIAAADSLVNYLRKMFGTDIRAIVPQLAMSAGTMIACSCKEIIMGKQSSLGPIDPQFNGIPVHGVIEEFERAIKEVKEHPESIPIWQIIVGKYHPTFIGECQNSIEWSKEIVQNWLETGMFKDDAERVKKAQIIVDGLNNHKDTKTHERHIPIEECEKLGLKVIPLEVYMKEKNFQDCVLTIHHSYMHTFSSSGAFKIIENHKGIAMIQQQMQQIIQLPQGIQGLPLNFPSINNDNGNTVIPG